MHSPGFYIALFIHLCSLLIGFGAVLVIDTFGVLMLFGKQSLAQVKKAAAVTQKLIWVGWLGMVISGAFLISFKGYIDNLTKIKIFFVLLIGFNGLFLDFIKWGLERYQTKKAIPRLWLFRIFLASAISQIGWWGAILIGFVHRHIAHNIVWPAHPFVYILGILATLGLTALVGEKTIKR